VAGALRDSGKALIIGENSYGKGSVQTIFRITDGSGLRLTTSKYFTPSGTDISEHGIVPDIKIVKDKSYLIANQSKAAQDRKNAGNKIVDGPFMELVEPRLAKFLEGKGWKPDKNQDASLEFAHMLLKNMTVANKKKTLEKARELAANILY
jgi:C-terminal processing protease CtpA/Prc